MTEDIQDYGYVWTGYNLPDNLEIFVGDFTGIGQDEVVAVHPTGSIYIFRYDGRVFRRISALNLGRRITKAVVGDVDGDGKKEIIIASGNSFVVFKWRGGRFERIHISAAMEVEITDITIGDLTGDLVDEIVIVVGRTKILIYKIQGGSLILITERVSRTSLQVRIGSVIRHHQKQLVTLEHVAGSGGDKLTLFILTNGQLEIVIEETIGMKADVLLGVKDVDNDFMDEIIISTSNRRRLLVLGVSGQSLARKWLSHGFSGVIEDVEVADWDKDGRPEIFVAVGAQVHVYKLRGRDFVLVKQIDMEVYVVSFAKGDVEKDGYIEVIVISKTGVIIIVKDFFEAKSQFLVQQTVHIPKNLPPAIKVAEVKVDKVIIFRKEAIKGKIIISGKFLVNILYVAEPDRRVFAIDAEIPFTHFVPVPGLLPRHRVFVDVEVEFVDFRFNPSTPRLIEVVIVAQILVFDLIVRERKPLRVFAKEHGVSSEDLAKINKLSIEGDIESGEKIKLPI
ncbi:FG-GAP-like repeat-containing protein [Desulfitibacter alkalitolerans]|uniref:FG-GAP-like repeat-containing protein n=1 Tax=Desulfitibacter alkalitolerans TaxID=264641 RepID=UPI0004835430|nr:FG-GAP-like repeat-containing protein [Desulfitibacter alkalitolerans]